MKLPRRQVLLLAAAAIPAVSRSGSAQSYPTRPVHLIEGFGAGGASDIIARLIGQSLSERLGQSFVVESRAGASSNIAAEAVVRAPPDGYTLLLVTTANAVNTTMFRLNFDFIRDIAPVASIVRVLYGGPPSVQPRPLRNSSSRQTNPGKINLASAEADLDPRGQRNVQDDGRHRSVSCALSRSQVFPLCAGRGQVFWSPTHRSRISRPATSAPWR